MAAAHPEPEDIGSIQDFELAFMKIVKRPNFQDFATATSQELVNDLTRFAIRIFPRRDTMEVLRNVVRKHISHDQMEAFVGALEKYMDRIHPDFCHNYCGDEHKAAVASVDLMNFTFALKFMIMEYVTWEEVLAVNEDGRTILRRIAARFLPILRTLKAMRSLITDSEPRPLLVESIQGFPESLELLERLLAEEDENPVKETLIEDFYNKHAREDIWNKVYQITRADDFLERNPGGNFCCYCLTTRLDCGNDFAAVNACWDLYCLRCVKRIGFGLGGICARHQCGKDIATYVSTNTYLKFRDEVNRNVLGAYQVHFLQPTQE